MSPRQLLADRNDKLYTTTSTRETADSTNSCSTTHTLTAPSGEDKCGLALDDCMLLNDGSVHTIVTIKIDDKYGGDRSLQHRFGTIMLSRINCAQSPGGQAKR